MADSFSKASDTTVLGTVTSSAGLSKSLTADDAQNWTDIKAVLADGNGFQTVTFSNMRTGVVATDAELEISGRSIIHQRYAGGPQYLHWRSDALDERRALKFTNAVSGASQVQGVLFDGQGGLWRPGTHKDFTSAGTLDVGRFIEVDSGTAAFVDCVFRDTPPYDNHNMPNPAHDKDQTTTSWIQHHEHVGTWQHLSYGSGNPPEGSKNDDPGYTLAGYVPGTSKVTISSNDVNAAVQDPVTNISDPTERAWFLSWMSQNDTALGGSNVDGASFKYLNSGQFLDTWYRVGSSWYRAPQGSMIDNNGAHLSMVNCKFYNIGYQAIRARLGTSTDTDLVGCYAKNCFRFYDDAGDGDNTVTLNMTSCLWENSSIGTKGTAGGDPHINLTDVTFLYNKDMAFYKRYMLKLSHTNNIDLKRVKVIYEPNDARWPRRKDGEWTVVWESAKGIPCVAALEDCEFHGQTSLQESGTFTTTGHNRWICDQCTDDGTPEGPEVPYAVYKHNKIAGAMSLDNCTFSGVALTGVQREDATTDISQSQSRAFTRDGSALPVYRPDTPPTPETFHHFVAPTDASPAGSSGNLGTQASPWTLEHVATGAASVAAGQIVALRGGRYSRLNGYDFTNCPGVTFKGFTGEKAEIDTYHDASQNTQALHNARVRQIQINVNDVTFERIRFKCTNPNERWMVISPSQTHEWSEGDPVRYRGTIQTGNGATGTRFIECIFSDIWDNVSSDITAAEMEFDGCISYNSGTVAAKSVTPTDFKGSGHALYPRNAPGAGLMKITNCVAFGCFGFGLHAFNSDAGGGLSNSTIKGCTFFGNERLYATPGLSRGSAKDSHWSTTAGAAISNVTFQDNRFYHDEPLTNDNMFHAMSESSIVLQDNRWMNGGMDFRSGGGGSGFWDPGTTGTGNKCLLSIQNKPSTVTIDVDGAPTGSEAFLENSTYRPGEWGLLTIYNWDSDATVNADLGSVLGSGDTYDLYHVFDYVTDGSPISAGDFTSGNPDWVSGTTIAVPMAAKAFPSVDTHADLVANITGYVDPTLSIKFGCFILIKTG